MNALAKTAGDLSAPPPISQPLAEAVAAVLNPHPDLAAQALVATDGVRTEAARRLRALDSRMQPASLADWAVFLKPLVASVRNPPSRDEFAAKASAIAFALPDVPAWMLSQDRQREALRRFDFWPSAAGFAEWLGPEMARLRAERSALARIAAAKPAAAPPPAEPVVRTPEEIEAVRAKALAFKAEMAAMARPIARGPIRQANVDLRHLLAGYERAAAEGGPFAAVSATRAAALRKQLGAEEARADG